MTEHPRIPISSDLKSRLLIELSQLWIPVRFDELANLFPGEDLELALKELQLDGWPIRKEWCFGTYVHLDWPVLAKETLEALQRLKSGETRIK